jgi:type I restriction enzyme M protein
VYSDATKQTPKVIIETKEPKRKNGIEQLKGYMNAEGAPVAVWSNGSDSIILYRPYPKEFDDTLFDIPRRGQEPKDVLEAKKTLSHLKKTFNFKKIVQDLEELVLADSGVDEFNEIFKLIFAKIWDEKEAQENRKTKEVEFRKSIDPEVTFDRINKLFNKACEEWPGIFREGENIELRKDHLQVCVGPIEGVRLLGSNLRIMDDAFEYLLPTEAKKKKGQFFTPRHVVEMCIRMLNPKNNEYILDPACGSGGFLLHAMDWCYPATTEDEREKRKHKYASKYLWGIDIELRAAKTSRALMLIAGDGHTNIFGPDVSSLDPKTWYSTPSGQALMQKLIDAKLLRKKVRAQDESKLLQDDDLAWEYFDELKFDIIMTNPPFAGEMRDKKMLVHYELAKPALKRANDKQAKEERDVLFIERILKLLKPGGRAAMVLPQGKFNNSSLSFIREWIFSKARIIAVVGLHPNTFKPHTGTKTSILFIQKYTEDELNKISKVKQVVAASCPDYEAIIKKLIKDYENAIDIPEGAISEDVNTLLSEHFGKVQTDMPEEDERNSETNAEDSDAAENDDNIRQARERVDNLQNDIIKAKQKLIELDSDLEAIKQSCSQEISAVENQYVYKKTILVEKRKIQSDYKEKEMVMKTNQKSQRQKLKDEIKMLEKILIKAEYGFKKLTNRGKLNLILEDSDLIGELKDHWISAEASKKLDYPIFMAVSERGGKDNSGDYTYLQDKDANFVEFPEGHPQSGLLMIDQDVVNYDFTKNDLKDATCIPIEKVCIAEAFISFAQKNKLPFWETI